MGKKVAVDFTDVIIPSGTSDAELRAGEQAFRETQAEREAREQDEWNEPNWDALAEKAREASLDKWATLTQDPRGQ